MENSDRNTPPALRDRASSFISLPFRNSSSSSAASSSNNQNQNEGQNQDASTLNAQINTIPNSVVSFVRSVIPALRLLKLDPSDNKLYFPYEPGKRVRSAVKITNTSKSLVAFKFQFMSEAASQDCYMRPPEKVLRPGESIITTGKKLVIDTYIHWLIKHPGINQMPVEKTRKIEFRILSLKVQEVTDNVAQLFVEKNHKVIMKQKLKAVFLDIEHPSDDLEKSKELVVEADAAYLASFPSTSGTKPTDDYDIRVRRGTRYKAWERRQVMDGSKKKVGETHHRKR